MTSQENKKTRILAAASRLFIAHGFRRVTMEEIARSAGVGKGTVYGLFESKQELMMSTVDFFGGQMSEAVGGIMADGSTMPLEKLQRFLKTITAKLSSLRSETLRDLEIDCPEAYEKIQQTRKRLIFENLSALLRDGKRFGVYDPEIDETLAAHVVIGAVDHISQPDVLASLGPQPEQLFQSVLRIILKGCLTPEYRGSLQEKDTASHF